MTEPEKPIDRIHRLCCELLQTIATAVEEAQPGPTKPSAFMANYLLTLMQVQAGLTRNAMKVITAWSRESGVGPVWIGETGKTVFGDEKEEDPT